MEIEYSLKYRETWIINTIIIAITNVPAIILLFVIVPIVLGSIKFTCLYIMITLIILIVDFVIHYTDNVISFKVTINDNSIQIHTNIHYSIFKLSNNIKIFRSRKYLHICIYSDKNIIGPNEYILIPIQSLTREQQNYLYTIVNRKD